nr:immunoglobulin heavy chain junction region [Macaca mulatta]
CATNSLRAGTVVMLHSW